jgi:hypothetical protein
MPATFLDTQKTPIPDHLLRSCRIDAIVCVTENCSSAFQRAIYIKQKLYHIKKLSRYESFDLAF